MQDKHRNAIEDQIQKLDSARRQAESGPILGDDVENEMQMEDLMEDLIANQEALAQEQMHMGLPGVESAAAIEAHSAIRASSPTFHDCRHICCLC